MITTAYPAAYLFPGQGAHAVGMGRAAYNKSTAARDLFERAGQQLGYDVAQLCFEGPLDKLSTTEFQQPALFTASLANWQTVEFSYADRVSGIHPLQQSRLAGQSMGEISALTAAGYFSFEDGLHLAKRRGELMAAEAARRPAGMTAVLGLSAETTATTCQTVAHQSGQIIQLANDNSPVQQIISGELDALTAAEAALKAAGAKKLVRLNISVASHCGLMDAVAEQFAEVLAKVEVKTSYVRVVGNVSADVLPHHDPNAIRRELTTQLTAPVRWRESMLAIIADDIDQFIEVGPGDVLTKLMKRIDRGVKRGVWQA